MHFKLLSKTLACFYFVPFLFQIGCDSNVFDTIPSEKCLQANLLPNTTGEFTETGSCLYTEDTFAGQVDVLFVVDNSKSMSVEHSKMAEKFPGFIDSLWAYDFRLAILTTDITKDPVQSGNFVTLSNGQTIISNQAGMSPAEVHQVFSNSIQRQETIDCEINQNNCPSGDVRGIYASNLALQKNDQSFFRPGAHLAIVILSDAR